jgi:hypothetical protein
VADLFAAQINMKEAIGAYLSAIDAIVDWDWHLVRRDLQREQEAL